MNYPCYKCENRHTACWGDCEPYKAFKAQIAERNKELQAIRQIEEYEARRSLKNKVMYANWR